MISSVLLLCVIAQVDVVTQTRTFDVQLITVSAPESARVSVLAETADRDPVTVRKTGARTFEFMESERVYLLISIVDFENGSNELLRHVWEPGGSNVENPVIASEGKSGNNWGLRELSRKLAPEHNHAVEDIYRKAADFVASRQKVAGVKPGDPRAKTDYVIGYWIQRQMQPIANSDARWGTWYANVSALAYELNRTKKIVTAEQWAEAFREIAAGLAGTKLTLRESKK